MKIAIYGVSRCGKDYLIEKTVEKMEGNLVHIKGSETLNTLALKRFGIKFKLLDEKSQEILRKEFTILIKDMEKKYENIVVDGHFSFPDGDGFKTVFTQEDLNLYDAFFYLNKSAELIRDNCMRNDKKQFEEFLNSEENINNWKRFEIENMKKEVVSQNKDFIILDDSTTTSAEFISEYIKKDWRTVTITKKIINSLKEKIKNCDEIVLTDLDKTLSIDDLTNDFVKYSNLEGKKIKNIFSGDYYTTYQFYKFHNYLALSKDFNCAVDYAIGKIGYNTALIKELENKKPGTAIIGITTGMADAWNKINKKLKILDSLIGKSTFKIDGIDTYITPQIKGMVANELKNLGKKVLSVGDSYIDLEMLTLSHRGYLVAMLKLDKRIEKRVEYLKDKNIAQLNFNKFKYEKIREVNTIWQ